MKTNKEIKPFKMRLCQNEALTAEGVLKKLGLKIKFMASRNENLCCVVYNDKTFSIIMTANYDRVGEDNTVEITYSEFMKLYGEEEEVFTSNDMKEFAEYALEWLGDTDPMFHNVSELLTKYLSERTND